MCSVSYKQTKIYYSPRMQTIFTLGLNIDLWKFNKATEKLERKEINVPIVANFTAIAETDDLLLVGTSNGALALYNMSSNSVILHQLFPLQAIAQINSGGGKVLVASDSSLVTFDRCGTELQQINKVEFSGQIF